MILPGTDLGQLLIVTERQMTVGIQTNSNAQRISGEFSLKAILTDQLKRSV